MEEEKQSMEEAGLLFRLLQLQKRLHVRWLFKKKCRKLMRMQLGFRIGINAGEPVEKSNRMFGDTIQFAANLCSYCR